VERSSRKLARTTFMVMGRYQAGLEQKQAVLGRIVDIGSELFAISATIAYADTIKREQPERGESAYALADLFAKQARRRVEDLFEAVWSNDDDANYRTAQRVLEGDFEWLEEGILEQSGDRPQVAGQPSANGGDDDSSREATTEHANGNGSEPVAAKVQ
jgi:hypothetical protein